MSTPEFNSLLSQSSVNLSRSQMSTTKQATFHRKRLFCRKPTQVLPRDIHKTCIRRLTVFLHSVLPRKGRRSKSIYK